MKDCSKYLAKALIGALNTATGIASWTKVPKGDTGNPVVIPYINITDMSAQENGAKNNKYSIYTLNIEIVYAGLDDKVALWDTSDIVADIFSNRVPFALDGGFEIMTTSVIGISEREDLFGSIDVDVRTINLEFLIENNNSCEVFVD